MLKANFGGLLKSDRDIWLKVLVKEAKKDKMSQVRLFTV